MSEQPKIQTTIEKRQDERGPVWLVTTGPLLKTVYRDCDLAAHFIGILHQRIVEQAAAIRRLRELEATQPCGHARRWLAYRDPTSINSEQYCVFCEIDRLRAATGAFVSR